MAKTELGTAYIKVVPSLRGAKASIRSGLSQEGTSAGAYAGKNIGSSIIKGIAGIGIGVTVAETIKKSFQEGGKLEQSIGGIETLFKNSSDAVIKNAEKAYKTAGLSANEYMETATSFSASLLQSLGGDTKKAASYADMAIIDMSDNANKMGTSMEMIQNAYQGFAKQNYTMLDNLKLGYGGTKQEMQRLLDDAEKMTGKKYDISSFGDITEAIHVIQKNLKITGTTSKEAASTLQGSLSSMMASGKNLLGQAAMGGDVKTALREFIDSTITFAFGNAGPMLGRMILALPPIAIDFIGKGIPKFLDKAGNKISETLDAIIEDTDKKGTPKIGTAIVKLGTSMIRFIIKIGPKLILAGGKLIGNFVEGLGGNALKRIDAAGNKIKARFMAPIENLKDKIGNIVDSIKGFFKFDIGAPHIPMPHFGISPDGWKVGDLLKGSIPKLNIDWYGEGGEFNSASVIGVGEKGPEAVVPLTKFWNKIDKIKESSSLDYNKLSNMMNSKSPAIIVINLDGKTIGEAAVEYINGQTIIFNQSPLIV